MELHLAGPFFAFFNQELAGPFFAFFNQEYVPWSIFTAIIVGTILLWRYFLSKIQRPRASLQKACARIKETDDAHSFATRYEELRQSISSDPILGNAWLEFNKTVLPPERAGEIVRITNRPAQYFNSSLLTSARINLSVYQAVPNILVGIGLLFTFLGLISALYFAAQGVASESVQDAQAALKELLHAATFKFVTSIAGLGMSIFFVIFIKRALHDFELDLNTFCQAIEKRVDFITPISLAHASHRELLRQTSELQRFNSDLAFSIAEALDNKMRESFAKVMEPMAAALQSMSDRIGQMNQEALTEMAKEFSKTLEGAAGKQISALVDGMKDVHGNLTGLISGLEQAKGSLSDRLAEATDEMAARISTTAETMQSSLSEAGSSFAGRIDEGGKALAKATDEMAARISTTAETMQSSLSEAGSSFAGRIDEGGKALANTLYAVAENMEDHINRASESLRNSIEGTIKGLSDSIRELPASMKSVESSLQALDGMLSKHRSDLSEILSNLSSSISAMKAVSNDLRAAGEPLADVVEGFGQAVNQLESVGANLNSIQEQLATLSTTLADTGETVGNSWNSIRERFEELDEGLADTFEEIQTGLDGYRRSVESFVTNLDKSMANSVSKLGGSIEGLEEQLDSLEHRIANSVDKLSDTIEGLKDHLKSPASVPNPV